MIRPVELSDAGAIAAIYNYYTTNTVITFEDGVVTEEQMAERIGKVLGDGLPWIVAEKDGAIVGYAYVSTWKFRSAYRFTVESTVYVAHDQKGGGVGSALYGELISQTKQKGMHSIVGVIALPNSLSVALHEKFGFEKVGHYKELGTKFGNWIDVGSWQLLL